ncbi:MAG: iron complex transport system ATP-binding protein [Verrucomicrobiota bacterium]|jgi:iron complex transport system ATP-binding protein|nr:iron complex transport system ATP-binding protein [Verrucomicrobiota bacterium]
MSPVIQSEELALELGGVSILKGISFSVAQGEYVSIIGPNGAGKTTILRCLLGMYTYEGSVRIAGTECSSADPKELARKVSYVPQTHDIEFPLPVVDFVMMGRYPYLSPLAPAQKKDIDAVEKAMEITGTTLFRDRLLRTLSGGERQKVYIAAALAQETPIMLLDEPATFLDWKHQAEIMQLLKKINTECGATILAVNHDLNSAAHWSDRIIAVKNGCTFSAGTPQELIQPAPLEQLFETAFIRKEILAPASES